MNSFLDKFKVLILQAKYLLWQGPAAIVVDFLEEWQQLVHEFFTRIRIILETVT